MYRGLTLSLLLFLILGNGELIAQKDKSQENSKKQRQEQFFESRVIADSVKFLWAHYPMDITNDRIVEIVFIDNNHEGGQLGFYIGKKEDGNWYRVTMDYDNSLTQSFAMGDLQGADMDNDGDMDIVAALHPGEWKDAAAPSELIWYEYPDWTVHPIGMAPDFIKDISIADFDQDGRKDIAVLTFEESSLSIFQQNEGHQWILAKQYRNYKDLHEGMDVGDLNGDEYPDIVAEAHVFYSPGGDLTSDWKTETIDEKWNSQTGDWSRNGTKIFIRDLDKDGIGEVFISHSERNGYPLVYYKKLESGWKEHVLEQNIPACHTLQVFDLNLDGYYDVLAGVNKTRAADLGITEYPVKVFFGKTGYLEWESLEIATDGIYNGQVIDYDKDGDLDILKYQSHDATELKLLENKLID